MKEELTILLSNYQQKYTQTYHNFDLFPNIYKILKLAKKKKNRHKKTSKKLN